MPRVLACFPSNAWDGTGRITTKMMRCCRTGLPRYALLTILENLEADASGLVIRKEDGDEGFDYGPPAGRYCAARLVGSRTPLDSCQGEACCPCQAWPAHLGGNIECWPLPPCWLGQLARPNWSAQFADAASLPSALGSSQSAKFARCRIPRPKFEPALVQSRPCITCRELELDWTTRVLRNFPVSNRQNWHC